MDIRFAPMEGLTDTVYRRTHHQHFCEVSKYYIPFVSPTQHRVFTPKELRAIGPEYNTGIPTVPQILAKDAGNVMEDLAVVAEALAAADLGSIVENVNNLTADSQNVIADAMTKLDTIDIATLNKAIKDLAAVVEPLAKVSKIFC